MQVDPTIEEVAVVQRLIRGLVLTAITVAAGLVAGMSTASTASAYPPAPSTTTTLPGTTTTAVIGGPTTTIPAITTTTAAIGGPTTTIGGGLPDTGQESFDLVQAGAVALLVGAMLVVVATIRRRQRDSERAATTSK